MKDLQIFKSNGWEIRTIEKDGAPWFVAADICASLKHTNTSVALNMLDDDERSKISLGRQGDTNIVNESGLYHLIMRSNSLGAKKFRKWVTSEVLPSIRKTGTYQHNIPKTLGEALQLAADQAKQLEEQAPMVEFANAVSISEDNITLNEMAKLSGKMGRNTMMDIMRDEAILMKSNLPYQTFINRGYFLIYESVVKRSYGTQIVLSTQVTPKGQAWMIKKINSWVAE